jgi:hypothetical protein
MDDFMFMTDSCKAALLLRNRVEALLHRLGFQRDPKKGMWETTQLGDHLDLTIDLPKGEFRAPIDKPHTLSKQASTLLGRAACNVRWLPARQVAAFAGKEQFIYLIIAPARFSLLELPSVLVTR